MLRIDTLVPELRFAFRSFRSAPSFTLAVLASLALGIGASTAVFSIADAVFLRPLPYAAADRLLWVGTRFPGMDGAFLASPDYVAWRRDNRVFESLAATQAHGPQQMLLNSSHPEQVYAARVSANFLKTFAIRPMLGRDFRDEEELPNGPRVVLLSNRLWREYFHADAGILGKAIELDGTAYTIAGVLPKDFVYPMDAPVDLLTTLPVAPNASHKDRSMSTWAVYGRLRPGVTLEQARTDLGRLFEASKADMPVMFRSDTRLVIEPLQQHRVGHAGTLLAILIAAASCLLFIACANVSNLLLGRWLSRQGEYAIRVALGAQTSQLARGLLVEAIVLAAAGCLAGIGIGAGLLAGFVHCAAGELPRLAEIHPDLRVVVIAVLLACFTVLLFGPLPVLRSSKSVQSGLRAGSGISPANTLRRALVITQIALSVVLLCGAAVLLESLWHLENDNLGFAPERTLVATIPTKGTRLDTPSRDVVVRELIRFARQIPGTEAAAESECTPLTAGAVSQTFSRADRPLPEAFHRGDNISLCGTESGYAQAAGIRVLRGRFFEETDAARPDSLVVLNEAAVRAYFPHEDPIGKRVLRTMDGKWRLVVGVVSDSKNAGLGAPPMPQAFINGRTWPDTNLQLIFGIAGNTEPLERALKIKLQSVDSSLMARFETMEQTIGRMSSGPRFNGILLASFAGLALMISVVGTYGLLAFVVARRKKEFGIRMALGADRSRILHMVLREGAQLASAGLIAGFALSLFATRYLKSILFGVRASDPLAFVIVGMLLGGAALAAAFLPARQAASVDPATALHHD